MKKNKKMAGLTAAVLALVSVQVASAAGQPAKAPIVPVPTQAGPSDWTGFYVGANVGYSWGRFNPADTLLNGTPFSSSGVNVDGVIAGGQAGYNWQIGSLVVGLEGDLQWSGQSGHGISNINAFVPGLGTFLFDQPYVFNLKYFGTVRGRLGYAADRWLLYTTGGWAFGREQITRLDTAAGSSLVSYSSNRNGWTAGGGVEYRIDNNWSWKAEYLYVDLGTWTLTDTSGLGMISRIKLTDNIFRVGVNYNFGAPANASGMPVNAAVYQALSGAAARPWTGLYAGINAGWGWSDHTGGDFSGDKLPFGTQFGINAGLFPPRINVKYDGFTGGVQAGYNWQWDSLVVGAEADINYADWAGLTNAPLLRPNIGAYLFPLSQKIDAFATVRGRLGFAPWDWTLLYLTGGFALGHAKTQFIMLSTNQPTFSGSETAWKTGWTFGGGVEQRLSTRWSAKIEILYYDLNNAFVIAKNGSPFFGISDTEYQGYLVRTGLNYKLN